ASRARPADRGRRLPVRVLKLDHAPRCVAYSPDGSLLCVGGADGVTLFSLPDAETLDLLDVEGQGVEVVAFSPNGEHLAAGGERDVFFWDVKGREEVARAPGHAGGTSALVWLPGDCVATAGWDRSIRWLAGIHDAGPAQSLQTAEPIAALIAYP